MEKRLVGVEVLDAPLLLGGRDAEDGETLLLGLGILLRGVWDARGGVTAVLGATAAMNLAAPLMMLKQKADFKPEQLAMNGAFVAGLGALAVKAYKDSK